MSASSTARIASHHGAIARSQYSAIRSTSAGSAAAGSSQQRARDGRRLAALERPPELQPHALRRGRAHARELLLDVGQRRAAAAARRSPARTGRLGWMRVEQRVVEAGEPGARLAHPRQMHRVARRGRAARAGWRRARTAARSRSACAAGRRGRSGRRSPRQYRRRFGQSRIVWRFRGIVARQRWPRWPPAPTAQRPPGFVTALRDSGAAAPFVASLIGRLPMGAVGLVFILRTNEITGSFALGGLATGAYALVDRRDRARHGPPHRPQGPDPRAARLRDRLRGAR